jgi:hypothetical protein
MLVLLNLSVYITRKDDENFGTSIINIFYNLNNSVYNLLIQLLLFNDLIF